MVSSDGEVTLFLESTRTSIARSDTKADISDLIHISHWASTRNNGRTFLPTEALTIWSELHLGQFETFYDKHR